MDLARNLKIDSVSRLFPTPPRQIAATAAIADAIEQMRRERVGCLLVCAESEHLIGIFTERDLITRVLVAGRPLTDPVCDVMTPRPITVQLKDSIRTALRLMQQGGYRHLPVLDSVGRPVGTLSIKRIVHYLAEHFPAIVYNLPPTPRAIPRRREGA